MDDTNLLNSILDEQRFWLQILGDHARFIFFSLPVTENTSIQKAQDFISIYDNLLEMARKQPTADEINELTKQALERTQEFRNFKLHLLSLILTAQLTASLSPTFFSHMINELEEYLLTISSYLNGKFPLFEPVHYHMLWLSDAIGHAACIASNLDEAEEDLIGKSVIYESQFTDLYMKATNLKGYMRTNINNLSSLERLNRQAAAAITPFKNFLEDMRNQRISGTVLGTFMPLMADHMAREECYYLTKLSEAANDIIKPDCDPGRPRVEE